MEIRCHNELLSWLEANAEPAFARFSAALIPDLQRKMWGVRIPKLRALAQSLVKSDWQWALREVLTTESLEEVLLRGFIIGYAKAEWTETWMEIRKFVPLIDNWEICDCCCSSFKSVRKHREEVWPVLMQYLRSECVYNQRFAVVMMMDYFLTAEYIDAVLKAWSETVPKGYYVEMAIGWGLSVSFLSFPQPTLEVLRDESVPLACRKKACQKILESRRTPEEWRAVIKTLKSKY